MARVKPASKIIGARPGLHSRATAASREEAESVGALVFFPAERCSRGHIANRYTATGLCVLCPLVVAPPLRRTRSIAEVFDELMEKRRLQRTPVKLLQDGVRARLSNAIKNRGFSKDSTTEVTLGCSWEEFVVHIERQFLPGMTWGNRSKWHIDHIVPRSSFSYSSPEDDDFRACWALTNLRPLWAIENIRKNAKRTFLL